jgi:hypothetical protein
MKEELLDLIVAYSKGDLSKEVVIEGHGDMTMDFLELYINDSNSSTLREAITCKVLGLDFTGKKLGYDSKYTNEEIKPRNALTTATKILDGWGNYSDLTWRRHNKYINDDVIVHVSGFVDGLLMYIVKFKYVDLAPYFQVMLERDLPDGDQKHKYVRTAWFTYTNIKDLPSFEIEFIRGNISDFEYKFRKDLFNDLTSHNANIPTV